MEVSAANYKQDPSFRTAFGDLYENWTDSKCLQGRMSMLHFYTHCSVKAFLFTCGLWQAGMSSFFCFCWSLAVWSSGGVQQLISLSQVCKPIQIQCLNSPRRHEGISDPLKTLLYLDSSMEPEGQYLMTEWFNPCISQALKWCQLQHILSIGISL